MSKREEFALTLEQGQRLVETCLTGRSSFPKKWGEKPVPENEQLLGREDLGDLLKALRSYSPWLQGIGDDHRVIFGDKADWYPVDKFGKKLEGAAADDERVASWKMVDSQKTYTVRLGREALSGAVWCCILRLHPHCIIPTSTREAVETWWPLAEVLGKATAVRKYIGLAAANRTDWEDDQEAGKDEGKK
jgi:hypothetical protein